MKFIYPRYTEELRSSLRRVRTSKIELEFSRVGFCGGRETGEHGENPRSKDENQQQTQPTGGTGPKSNPGHIGGRRALSPLRHPCCPALAVITFLDNWNEITLTVPLSMQEKRLLSFI